MGPSGGATYCWVLRSRGVNAEAYALTNKEKNYEGGCLSEQKAIVLGRMKIIWKTASEVLDARMQGLFEVTNSKSFVLNVFSGTMGQRRDFQASAQRKGEQRVVANRFEIRPFDEKCGSAMSKSDVLHLRCWRISAKAGAACFGTYRCTVRPEDIDDMDGS